MVSKLDTKVDNRLRVRFRHGVTGSKPLFITNRFRQCVIRKSHDALYMICNPPYTKEESTASQGIVVEEELWIR